MYSCLLLWLVGGLSCWNLHHTHTHTHYGLLFFLLIQLITRFLFPKATQCLCLSRFLSVSPSSSSSFFMYSSRKSEKRILGRLQSTLLLPLLLQLDCHNRSTALEHVARLQGLGHALFHADTVMRDKKRGKT